MKPWPLLSFSLILPRLTNTFFTALVVFSIKNLEEKRYIRLLLAGEIIYLTDTDLVSLNVVQP